MPGNAPVLGSLLLERKLIAADALNASLALQRKNGGRLGEILMAEGHVAPAPLHRALAERADCPFLNLLELPSDPALAREWPLRDCLRLRAVPWRRIKDVTVIATCEITPALRALAASRHGTHHYIAMTSPGDIRHALTQVHRDTLDEESRHLLWNIAPERSARTTFRPEQRRSFLLLLAGAVAALLLFPVQSIAAALWFCQLLFLATMAFKTVIFLTGEREARRRKAAPETPEPDERHLPVYTVLVPMYRETESLPGLLAALDALDYPRAKLDIKLIVEADDGETLAAAKALRPRYHCEILRVPFSLPRTKPKACNYALRFARGEYVTVFDADDRPEPRQLKKAVAAFRRLPPDVVCLQARLNYYNAGENLLTSLFALEYATLFDATLPGLEKLGIPIPLGGTSNHIALQKLRDLGEWDPYNVTEDADLGLRLAASRYRTAMLDSYTLEEAPVTVPAWLRQRSRWIKGYMQTWLVHMRAPAALYRALGFTGFFGFQFFVGISCFTFLVAPPLWGFSLAALLGWRSDLFPESLYRLAVFNLLAGFFMLWYAAWRMRRAASGDWALAAIASFPYYWLLHSLASYKALWQLLRRPHFWEKTVHGLSRFAPANPQ